jgi:hypothetical protein
MVYKINQEIFMRFKCSKSEAEKRDEYLNAIKKLGNV